MSKEVLEKAFEKTKEIEKKQMKKLRLAENIGRLAGITVAVAMDTTAVWLIIKFMLGFAAFTWINALGVMLLANILYIKLKN
jgi:predicted metalloendopeptidase